MLQQGCTIFMRDFEAKTGFNPFTKATIASACNWDLRKNRLEADTIATEPLHGWRRQTKHSNISFEWLGYLERVHHLTIQHARNRGEFKIPTTRYSVDGYDASTRTVYEFLGCFYHGCNRCFPSRFEPFTRLLGRNMASVFSLTHQRLQTLRNLGYTVKTMWECEWRALKSTDESVQRVVASLNLQPPLDPRDAFFGVRTNAVKLFHQISDDEQIRYFDFTSLYPTVDLKEVYPVGHPTIVYNPQTLDISQYFGIAKVSILPPAQLYHPVLPYKTQNKLTFPLCRTCVDTQIQLPASERTSHCSHTAPERMLVGTSCTPEIELAVSQGYRIQNIHEVWHFERQNVVFLLIT